MDIKKVVAVGVLVMAIIVNGCGQKPGLPESNEKSGIGDKFRPDPKYAASVDIGRAGLQLDYLNENISVSPDGKMGILVASKVPKSKLPKGQQVDFESHLVLVDLMNGEVSSLDQGEYITPIEWSPQGDKILYRKDDNLYIIETAPKRIYQIAAGAYCGSISPEGTRVAFVQREKGLFVANVDGSRVKQLTGDKGDWYPVWYPDGRSLFYFADRQVELGDGAGRLQGLGRVDVETGRKDIMIPDEKGKYRRAEWVIPGKTLLVNKGWDDGFYEIVVNLESGEVHQLGENAGTKTYSTAVDKSRGIVYKAQGNEITGIDVNGLEIVAFSLLEPKGMKFSQDTGVAVSPDGKLLAYQSPEQSSVNGKDEGRRVWIVNADGSSPVQLTGDSSGHYAPVWTPDAKKIIILEIATTVDRGFTLKIIEVNTKI